jgi:hypothetical protein
MGAPLDGGLCSFGQRSGRQSAKQYLGLQRVGRHERRGRDHSLCLSAARTAASRAVAPLLFPRTATISFRGRGGCISYPIDLDYVSRICRRRACCHRSVLDY